MTWRIAHRGEYGDSEWVAVKDGYQCAIPLFHEKSRELVPLATVKKNWKGTWLETAQADVIKVQEGYVAVNPDGRYRQPPSFKQIEDPRPHCLLRRVS